MLRDWPAHTAAAILATLALLHLIYTLHDMFVRPRYFKPADPALLERMQETTVAIAPGGHNFWQMALGVHLSHAIGILLYAAAIELAIDPALTWLRPFLVSLGFVYVLIGWTCWFHIPAIGISVATALLVLGWYVI